MTHVLDWKRAEDPRDVVHLAVQALAEGHLVGLPTDTLYNVAASCLHTATVPAIENLKKLNPVARPTVALRSVEEAVDYCPAMSPVARRLAKCLWPGPLGLVLDGRHPDSLVQRFLKLIDRLCSIAMDESPCDLQLMIPFGTSCIAAGPLVLIAAPVSESKQPTVAHSSVGRSGDCHRRWSHTLPRAIDLCSRRRKSMSNRFTWSAGSTSAECDEPICDSLGLYRQYLPIADGRTVAPKQVGEEVPFLLSTGTGPTGCIQIGRSFRHAWMRGFTPSGGCDEILRDRSKRSPEHPSPSETSGTSGYRADDDLQSPECHTVALAQPSLQDASFGNRWERNRRSLWRYG